MSVILSVCNFLVKQTISRALRRAVINCRRKCGMSKYKSHGENRSGNKGRDLKENLKR